MRKYIINKLPLKGYEQIKRKFIELYNLEIKKSDLRIDFYNGKK